MRTTQRVVVALVALVAATSCTSATKRLEQGQQFEQQGRRADAARRYIDALRKDAGLVEARQRLLESGNGAIDDYVHDADDLASSGRFMNAADAFVASDLLINDAIGVGVTLRGPARYAERRREAFDRASDQAVEASSAAIRRADFAESVRLIEHAQKSWDASGDRQIALNRGMFDAQASWARDELTLSHFRSAHEHAEAALAVPGFADSSIEQLQADALRRGTVVAAAFPVVARAGTDSRILAELNDVLALEHWQRAPKWVSIVNSIETQRIVRNRGMAGRELSIIDATSLGRQLGAQYALALTLDSVRFSDVRIERRRVAARTRSGVDTAYTIEDGRLEMWARVSWRLIAVGGDVLNHGESTDRSTTQIHRGVYAGNWRDLDLATRDRGLFDAPDPRDNQEMLRQLARVLADELGRNSLDALLRRVD